MKTGFLILSGWALMMLGAQGADWRSAFAKEVYTKGDGKLPYRLATVGEGEKLPLVVFLHGLGESGDDNEAQLKHGMKDFLAWCRKSKQSCRILAPQCRRGGWWSNTEGSYRGGEPIRMKDQPSLELAMVFDVVDRMVKADQVDTERIYITGLSIGGFGTFDAISRRPEFFAAAMPVCGGGDPTQAVKFKELPLWVFHGGKDNVVPEKLSADVVAAVKEAGGTPKYRIYPEANHNSWTATYSDGEVWKWLFEQSRK